MAIVCGVALTLWLVFRPTGQLFFVGLGLASCTGMAMGLEQRNLLIPFTVGVMQSAVLRMIALGRPVHEHVVLSVITGSACCLVAAVAITFRTGTARSLDVSATSWTRWLNPLDRGLLGVERLGRALRMAMFLYALVTLLRGRLI